jgi:hypothetical protein
VRMRVPYAPELATNELLAKLAELAKEDEIDPRARGPLEATLLHRFSASPEATGLTNFQACHFVMDFAADYFSETIATLGAKDLEEIVFEILPRKMTIDASEAGWIIDTNRAFYAYLKRELGLPQADACLRVLGPGAVKELEAALSDTGNFGLAKSLMMGGREAGFDMGSKEGIEAWMREVQSKPLPASFRLPSAFAAPRAASRASKAVSPKKKQQRKAARQARKRNR